MKHDLVTHVLAGVLDQQRIDEFGRCIICGQYVEIPKGPCSCGYTEGRPLELGCGAEYCPMRAACIAREDGLQ